MLPRFLRSFMFSDTIVLNCVRDINASLNLCGLNCKITGRYFGDAENGSYQKNASDTKMEFNKGDLQIITDSFLPL